jgi:site-specific recombinase XerD
MESGTLQSLPAPLNPDEVISLRFLTARAIRHIVLRAGEEAHLPFPVHPHMLRHACGFYLANRGVDTRAIQHYLGHRNIQHTVRYTELAPQRFSELWED